MAKETKRIAFTNAYLDVQEMTISEFDRDGEEIQYDLRGILEEYSRVPGVSLTISKCEDLTAGETDEI